MRQEERGGEQADDGEARPVRIGELSRDGTGVRDVPGNGEAEGEPAEDC